MRKPAAFLFAVLVGALIWFFLQHFQLQGVERVRFVPKEPASPSEDSHQRTTTLEASGRPPAEVSSATGGVDSRPASDRVIRVATFHLDHFGDTKLQKPAVLDFVARIVQRFEIVALQGIATRRDDAVPRLVDLVNQAGRSYDYIVGPRLGLEGETEQYAYVFDRQAVLTDRDELYTLGDPDDLLRREPLVAWFRTVGPAERPFTFSLVCISTDARRNEQELNVLDDVFYEVRDDGREEDDVIMLGDFNASDGQLRQLGEISGIVMAIRGAVTTVEATTQTENILLDRNATDEFTGRSGVFDFLRHYNMSVERAREVSRFLPVWAEFTVREGGARGRVANRDEVVR